MRLLIDTVKDHDSVVPFECLNRSNAREKEIFNMSFTSGSVIPY